NPTVPGSVPDDFGPGDRPCGAARAGRTLGSRRDRDGPGRADRTGTNGMHTTGQGAGAGAGLDAELDYVKGLAREAAARALARARQVTPQEKANLSYVTELAHDLERLIRDRLAARFPDDALTGEEYAEAGGAGPRRWSIDPIDGTGNMVHGLPLWAVSVGLIDAGEPVLGVI